MRGTPRCDCGLQMTVKHEHKGFIPYRHRQMLVKSPSVFRTGEGIVAK
jgi:hypothetical protein